MLPLGPLSIHFAATSLSTAIESADAAEEEAAVSETGRTKVAAATCRAWRGCRGDVRRGAVAGGRGTGFARGAGTGAAVCTCALDCVISGGYRLFT
eukprot:6192507-Pleurochrysis_carterae.AAC.1